MSNCIQLDGLFLFDAATFRQQKLIGCMNKHEIKIFAHTIDEMKSFTALFKKDICAAVAFFAFYSLYS